MSLIKFKDYTKQISEGMAVEVLGENDEDVVVVEWTEENWKALSISEQVELESEAVNGWAVWQIGELTERKDSEIFEAGKFLADLDEEECGICGDDPCSCDVRDGDNADIPEEVTEEELVEYKARNTMQRRATQKNKDRQKFQNRATKIKAKIERKKGGNKVKRIKLRKKWMRKNKSKIRNANKVFGGKVKSKFTKK